SNALCMVEGQDVGGALVVLEPSTVTRLELDGSLTPLAMTANNRGTSAYFDGFFYWISSDLADAGLFKVPVDASSPVRLVPFPPFNKGSLALHADEQSVLGVEDRTSELFSALPDGGPKHLASLGPGPGAGMARLDGL